MTRVDKQTLPSCLEPTLPLDNNNDAVIYWAGALARDYSRHFTNLNPFILTTVIHILQKRNLRYKEVTSLAKFTWLRSESSNPGRLQKPTLNPPTQFLSRSRLTSLFPGSQPWLFQSFLYSMWHKEALKLQNVLQSVFLCSKEHTLPETMTCGVRRGKLISGCHFLAPCHGAT